MATITYILPDQRAEQINAKVGDTAMQVAVNNEITGIVAECGGNAMCATCHVYVDGAWLGRLPAMSADEDALLDGAAAERRPNSRLSCQIRITEELDGLVLQLPERQI